MSQSEAGAETPAAVVADEAPRRRKVTETVIIGPPKGGLLQIGRFKVPLDDEENAVLLAKLQRYLDENGVLYGFAREVLGVRR